MRQDRRDPEEANEIKQNDCRSGNQNLINSSNTGGSHRAAYDITTIIITDDVIVIPRDARDLNDSVRDRRAVIPAFNTVHSTHVRHAP